MPKTGYHIGEPTKARLQSLGLVHHEWRTLVDNSGDVVRQQMGCGCVTRCYVRVPDDTLVTCLWCVVCRLPELRWESPAEPRG